MANVADGRPSDDGNLFHINLAGSNSLAESEYAIRFGCCRLCCNDESNLRELFPAGYRDEVLLRKIVACTTVKIEYSDDEDALICFACVSKIEEFYQYREQCRTNDVLQRNWKRRLARSIEAAPATLIPVDSIKQEKTADLDSFYEDHELEDTGEFQSTGGLHVLDSSEPHATTSYEHSTNARPLHNLLEPMDDPVDEFFDYRSSDGNYEGSDDGTYSQVQVKQELDLEDHIDERLYVTSDDEIQHDPNVPRDNHTAMVIDHSTMTPEENVHDVQWKHRRIKSKSGKDYICCEGFLFSQRAPAAAAAAAGPATAVRNSQEWHCVVRDCNAMLKENNSNRIVSGVRQHNHQSPVTKNATVHTIVRYLSGLEETEQLNQNKTTRRHRAEPEGTPSTSDYQFVVNMRNGTSIVHNGFQYSQKHKRMDGTIYWKCRVNGGSCEAGIFLTPSKTIETIGKHNHDAQCLTGMQRRRRRRHPADQRTTDDEDELPEEDGSDAVHEEGEASGQNELVDQSEDIDLSAYLSTHMNAESEPQDPPDRVETPSDDVEEAKPAGRKTNEPSGVPGTLKRGYNFQIVRNVNQKLRLLFDGCLYEKENQREDGAIIWRCRRNYDRCHAQAIQHQHGLVEIVGTHVHDQVRQKRVNLLSSSGSFAYRLIRMANGREQLIHDGFRYQRRCVNGKMTDRWRCVNSAADCRAMVVVAMDGMVYTLQSQTHCHEPTEKQGRRAGTGESNINTMKQPLVSIRPLNILKASDRLRTKTPSPRNVAGHVTRIIPAMARRYGYRLIQNKKGNEGLVLRGYRYCKRLVRPDGTIKWHCRMNLKTCTAKLTMAPNGSIVHDGTAHHNHAPTDEMPKEPKPKVVKNGQGRRVYALDEKTFTESEWYFVKNVKNGDSLVHAGFRYTRKGDRVDKSSLWRCSQRTLGCWAGIILFPDETIAKANEHEHCHPPTENDPNRSGSPASTSPWTTAAADTESDQDQDQQLSDEDDKPKLRRNSSTVSGLRNTIPKTEAGYRIVKNRLNTNSLLFRGGRFLHRGKRSDGSVAWICNMSKHQCRASIKIHDDGQLEIVHEQHNHALAPEEDDASQDEEVKKQEESEEDEKKPAHGGNQEYYYSVNRINRECLVYEHCRYGKSGTRADGTVMWRCGMNGNTCMARLCVDPQGKLTLYREYKHNHRPLEELPPVVRLPDQATDSGPASSSSSATTLTPKTVNTKPVIKGNIISWNHHRYRKMQTVQTDGSSVWACTTSDQCSAKVKTITQEDGRMKVQSLYSHNHDPPDQQQQQQQEQQQRLRECDKLFALYRTPRGRLSLLYEGYRYSLQSQRVDGHSLWRCYAKKLCRAGVVVSVDGTSVTKTKDEHIHGSNADGIAGMKLSLGRKPGAPTFRELVKRFIKHRSIPLSVVSVEEERAPVMTASPSSTSTPSVSSSSRRVAYTDHGEYGFEKNKKGQRRLVHEGRRYYLGYTLSNGVNVWRCAYRKPLRCAALLRLSKTGKIISSVDSAHNHPIDVTTVAERNNYRSSAAVSSSSSRPVSQQELETADSSESSAEEERREDETDSSYRTDSMRKASGDRHNHDKVPSAPIYREQIGPEGTRDFQFEGRFGRTIRCQNFRYQRTWERKDGLEYYRCIGFQPYGCLMMMKLSTDKVLTHHRGEVHSHPPCAPCSASVPNSPLTGSAKPSTSTATTKRTSLASSNVPECGTTVYKDYRMMKKPRGSILQHHGYEYWTHSRLASGTVSYRCRMQFKLKCFATVSINSSGLLTMRNDLSHNHAPTDPTYVAAEQEEKSEVDDTNTAGQLSSLHRRMIEMGQRKAKENSSSSTDEEQNDDGDDDEEEGEGEEGTGAGEELGDSSNSAVVASGSYTKKTKKYSFIKVSQYKRCLLYEDYFYDFDKDLPDGHKRYVCSRFTSNNACQASVLLLMPSGRLLVSTEPIKHTHNPPESEFILRNIGRGSRHFEITQSRHGRSVLLYEGQRYQTPRSKPDGSVIWSCQELIGQNNKRCYVSQEILPNGRAAPPSDREHQHPPWQSQQQHAPVAPRAASVEATPPVPSSPTKILLHGGYRYEYGRKCADNSILWLCSRRPDCQASIYRLANGGILNGMKTEHTHRPDVVSGTEVPQQQQQTSTNLTAADRPRIASNVPRRFSYPTPRAAATASSTGPKPRNSIGAMCYKGYRYWHNRTLPNGVQYWRCCKRQKQHCLVTLQILPDGMIVDDRNHTHTHPGEGQQSPLVQREQPQTKDLDQKEKEDEDEEEEVVAPRTTRYSGYRLYRSHLRSDGSAIYQCRRSENCPYQVLRLANGEMVARTDAKHNCETTQTSDNDGNYRHDSAVDQTSKRGPESDQRGDDREDSSILGPSVKRIRLVANFEQQQQQQQEVNEGSIDRKGEISDNDDNDGDLMQLSSNNNHDGAKAIITVEQDDDDSYCSIPVDDPESSPEAIEKDLGDDEAAVAVPLATEQDSCIQDDVNENTEEPDWNRQDHSDKEENVLDPGKLVDDTVM